jgi:hypothetical protein
MVVETKQRGPDALRILQELARTMERIPAVTVERVDEDTLEITSDEPERDAEIRALVLERLPAIDLGWDMHVQLAEG